MSRHSAVLVRTLTHTTHNTTHIIMLAQKVTVSAKTTAVVKTPVAKRGATIVRRNSKGGEEGARDFGNTYVFLWSASSRRMRARANGTVARDWMEARARVDGGGRARVRGDGVK